MSATFSWDGFVKMLFELKTEKELSQFLQLLLTIDEREDLAKRLAIIEHLSQGKLTQRELAKKLDVSIAMITRGSNALKAVNEDVRKLLQQQFGYLTQR